MPQLSAHRGRQTPPRVLPVFPLTGSLLLPGNYLPLNIFEPRYRNMVEDVRTDGGHIGMIQPLVPGPDQLGLGEPAPQLYSVGCAGLLERAERQDDGRFLILLRGVTRFRIEDELAPRRGYRRVRAGYAAFAADLEGDDRGVDAERLLAAVARFGSRREIEFDVDLLASLDGLRLLNALAAALPFAPAEQQALLEAPSSRERQRLLLQLIEMDAAPRSDEPALAPPTVN